MILAAGLGTRLGDITAHTPKALVDVAGQTALERVARSLIAAGADHLIINVHHHADSIEQHVRERGDFGVRVSISHERDAPLETGGGLLHAAPLVGKDMPFFLHNVDVLCTADLRAMYRAHEEAEALATLAVSGRQSRRLLTFDPRGLAGRFSTADDTAELVREPVGDTWHRAFAGIHVISPALFDLITERGAFGIMDVYLRLAAAGHALVPWDIGDAQWLEIGNPERLQAARRALGG